ncbi:MAG: hypothetical protein ABEI58_00155 [Candidatus Nanohaloarchaea archaeon]
MIEKNQELEIGGVPATELAEEYGTPLYVYDRETIERQYRRLEGEFGLRYDNFAVSYAVKANFNPSIVEVLVEQGAGLDCASTAEIELAKELGAEEVMYTAPYVTKEEVDSVCEEGVTVNFDGIYAFEKADEVPDRISFRIDPGVGRGDLGLVFAGDNSKFGVPEERAVEAYRRARERGVERFGIHMMTGSNVCDPDYFAQITEKLLEIAGRISDELGIVFEFVDIGGGLGVPYEPDEEPLDIEETAEKVVETFETGLEENDIGDPELRVIPCREVGRSSVLRDGGQAEGRYIRRHRYRYAPHDTADASGRLPRDTCGERP